MGSGIVGGSEEVMCFENYKGDLYVGGYFSEVNGNPGNCIAKWNGEQWSKLNGGLTGFAIVKSMKGYQNELFVGGIFYEADGLPIHHLAKWDGLNWCGLGFSTSNDGGITSLAVLNDSLFIGGGFDIIDSDTMRCVSKWIGEDYTDTCSKHTSTNSIIKSSVDFNLFPNPSSGEVAIINKANSTSSLTIINTYGVKVFSMTLPQENGTNPIHLDLSEFSEGLYFVQISYDESSRTKKLIIKK